MLKAAMVSGIRGARLTYLDMAKGAGIFLVVLGHVTYLPDDVLRWISSFHMPLFFVIGGVLAYVKRTDGRPLRVWVCRKARGVLLPYASFSIMLLAFNGFGGLTGFDELTAAEYVRQLIDALTGYGIHILWFLPAYFAAVTAFETAGRKLRPALRNTFILAIAAAAFMVVKAAGLEGYATHETTLAGYILPDIAVSLLRAALMIPFVLMGWYLGAALEWFEDRGSTIRVLPVLLLIPGAYLAYVSSVFDIHYLYVEPVHYLSAFLSCTGLLFLMCALPRIGILEWLGQGSLVIMCTHAAFRVVYYASVAVQFLDSRIPVGDVASCLCVAVLVCAAEVPIVWIFNNFFGFLIGRTADVCAQPALEEGTGTADRSDNGGDVKTR